MVVHTLHISVRCSSDAPADEPSIDLLKFFGLDALDSHLAHSSLDPVVNVEIAIDIKRLIYYSTDDVRDCAQVQMPRLHEQRPGMKVEIRDK